MPSIMEYCFTALEHVREVVNTWKKDGVNRKSVNIGEVTKQCIFNVENLHVHS